MARRSPRLNKRILRQVRAYRKALRDADVPVRKLVVFGSTAKGTRRRTSDVDLAVVSPAFGRNYHRELLKLMKLRAGVSYDIEPHPFHPRDLKDRWDPLAAEVRKHGIPVR